MRLLRLTLAVVLGVGGAVAVAHCLAGGRVPHCGIVIPIGAVEAVGAVLFLTPRGFGLGALSLLTSLTAAIALHAVEGSFDPGLVVYVAAVLAVTAQRRSEEPEAAAP